MTSLKKFALVFLFLLLAGLAAFTLTSCGARTETVQDARASEGSSTDNAYGYATKEAGPSGDISSQVVGQSQERHVIRNGSLELTVLDTRGTVNQIKNITASAGGIIGSAYVYELKEGLYAADLTLRVPAVRFDPVMDQLQELGKAANIGQSNQDVTMQYVDTEARLKTLHAQEERLREILAMAKTVEEVLQVERELVRVRSEIEVMTAQFTYLQDQVVFSTITLRIKEEAIATQTISPAPFANLGSRIREAFVRSINFVTTVIAGLIVVLSALLPVLVIIAIAVLLVRFFIIRRARRRNTPPA